MASPRVIVAVVCCLWTYQFVISTQTAFRLVGGHGPWEGRLEVLHDNQYGTVCDDEFGPEEAKVICAMMGYGFSLYTGGKATANTKFGQGSGPIWLDNLNCSGSEKDISECQSNGWGVTDCDHSEDVGVVCPKTRVHLQYGPNQKIGRVQLSVPASNTWHAICSDGWGEEEANVICRMVGHTPVNGSARPITAPYYFSTSKDDTPQFSNFSCVGNETDIVMCNHTSASATCRSGAVAGVSCVPLGQEKMDISLTGGRNAWEGYVDVKRGSSNGHICTWQHTNSIYNDNLARLVCNSLGYYSRPLKPNITAVRLVEGRFPWEGRVEVMNWGHWGGVCRQSWTKETAAVVCTMLGFHPKYVFATSEYGNESAVLQQFSCHGNEENLNDCSLSPHKLDFQCNDGISARLRCVEFDIADVIDVECSQHSWLVAVNMTLLKAIHPTASPANISMGHIDGCKGALFNDGLLFYHLLDDCYTTKRVLEEQNIYYNHLSYVDSDHNGIDSTIWKYHLECSVYHERTPAKNSTTNKPIDISFYSDPMYLHALPEGSLPTQIQNRVYVRVSPENATPLKMILKDCQVIETGSGSHVLIKNGCEVNKSTHISLLSDVESRFSFSATWIQTTNHSAGRGHVTCDVKFCHMTDWSPSCYHGCRNPQPDIPIIG